jgi:site-specific recombinase XerC
LAAIRGFLKFCKDNQIIFGNPADTIPGPIREQKDLARNETSMDQRTVRYRIHKYYEEAGIRKKGSVHTLRHTFATHQVHNGLKTNQLKEVLGHKKMETTYKYVHLDRTNLRQEMEQGAL